MDRFIAARPELAPLANLQPSLRLQEQLSHVDAGGLVIRGRYAAPEPLAKVFNNYLSPGLHGKAAYDAYRFAGNALNQAQLGLSAFHAVFTSMDVMVSKAALGIEQVTSGRPSEALRRVANVFTAPIPTTVITNLIRGDKVLRRALMEGPVGEEMKLVLAAGGRLKMDKFYKNNSVESFMRALRTRNYPGAVLRAPFAAIEAAAKPVMEWLVPRQKLGAFIELAKREVGRLGPDAPKEELRYALGRAWDSIENRMGQLTYDNLFWNRVVKDLGLASVRSLGWNIGTIRELGGGVLDVAAIPKRAMAQARGERLIDPAITHRMAYTLALPYVVGLYGAVTMYLLTGEGPKETVDYYFPRTGNRDKNGKEERLAIPGYIKDVVAWTKQPLTTAKHKVNPLITAIMDMLQNEEWYKTPIRNPEDPLVQQAADVAAYMARQFEPFSFRYFRKAREEGESVPESLRSFVGLTKAPRYVTEDERPARRRKGLY